MGNLTFDISPAPGLLAQGRSWRAALGRPVLLAAVTREGEEAALLASWRSALLDRTPRLPHPLVLLVPRHPQRFDEVAGLVIQAGLRLARRSDWGAQPSAQAMQADVWLGDTLGEMALYYACADVALLGGSFAPLGGQNLIEAAACGCPLLMGPHTFNFAQAAQDALAAGAAERQADLPTALARALVLLDGSSDAAALARRRSMAAAALQFAAAHRGAAQRMASAVLACAAPRPSERSGH